MPIETGVKPENQTSGDNSTTTPSREHAPISLREAAEAAWDEVVEDAEGEGSDDDGSEGAVDEDGVKRDARGRFASKDGEPGEAEVGEPPSPAVDPSKAPDAAKPADPALGSNQPPQHWSEQDRSMFQKLPQEGQAFLLRRHTEMERDYTTKAQQNATAVQFTEAVGQMFSDPVISQSLQREGLAPIEAIHQLLGMHRRAQNPDPREKVNLLVDIARNIGLDPAAVFAPSQPATAQIPGLTEQDKQDPAIRYFADHLGNTARQVQALRGQIESIQRAGQQQAQSEALKVTRWGIDSFAEEKGQDGRPLHPHFDAVLPHIIELFRANPQRDLREAYQTALWMDPGIRAQLQQADTARVQQGEANRRASIAARSNVRGRTSPVSKPNGPVGDGPRSLRDVIESTADELGF